MIPAKTVTLLRQIHRDLTEIQILRQEMRRAPDQISRDQAIIDHARAIDQIIEALQSLEDAGFWDELPLSK